MSKQAGELHLNLIFSHHIRPQQTLNRETIPLSGQAGRPSSETVETVKTLYANSLLATIKRV